MTGVINKKVMVFGVFDGLHPGHRSFLRQAKHYGKKFIVVVARDSTVMKLKGKMPEVNERKRLAALREVKEVSRAVLGDTKQGSYGVIKKYKPDAICLGYDQKWLEKDLKMRMEQLLIPKIHIIYLKPFHSDKFKSSKMSHSK